MKLIFKTRDEHCLFSKNYILSSWHKRNDEISTTKVAADEISFKKI